MFRSLQILHGKQILLHFWSCIFMQIHESLMEGSSGLCLHVHEMQILHFCSCKSCMYVYGGCKSCMYVHANLECLFMDANLGCSCKSCMYVHGCKSCLYVFGCCKSCMDVHANLTCSYKSCMHGYSCSISWMFMQIVHVHIQQILLVPGCISICNNVATTSRTFGMDTVLPKSYISI
jgi:hypothetical protein